jgi:glutamate/tyrosine decarboxylase-like PLP-dependent enzyme
MSEGSWSECLRRPPASSTAFPGRRVAARTDVEGVAAALRRPFPDDGAEPLDVIEELIAGAEPGLVAMPSGRFFGWVIGGVLPAPLAADWLTSTWDQNAGLLASSPAAAAAEWVASEWLLDLLGLPSKSAVGFVTGAMIANFTCLAAARHEVLRRAGWSVERDGLPGAPRVTVIVGEERHETIDLALRFLGLGEERSIVVPVESCQLMIKVGSG